jgi:hypothetical protein
MHVEAVGILIDVGLQVEYRMVDAPQPGFEQHHRSMELGEVLPLLFGFLPDQLWEFAFQAFITAPPVSPHLCTGSYMVQHEPLQVLLGRGIHHPTVDVGNTFPFTLHGHHPDLLLALVPPQNILILASHIGLLYINLPVHRVVSAARHRLHYFLLEQPAGLLPEFKLPAQFSSVLLIPLLLVDT